MKLKKLQLSSLPRSISGEIDLFVCSSSFEDRCLSIPRQLSKLKVKETAILNAIDLDFFTGRHSKTIQGFFGTRASVISVSTKDPIFSADSLFTGIFKDVAKKKHSRILIDITTFTHELLLILIKLLTIFAPSIKNIDVTLLYASASDYSIGDTVKFKWLSKGVEHVRTILGFPGDNLPSRRTHLIILVGYELERAMRLIEILEPNTISLGFGRSGTQTTEKNRTANKHFHMLLRRLAISYADVENFEISCNDPIETKNELMRIRDERSGSNILLAPMNNKMSTLGAAMAALTCHEIQVCYAPVLEYNFENYSSPGKSCYVLQLPELLNIDNSR